MTLRRAVPVVLVAAYFAVVLLRPLQAMGFATEDLQTLYRVWMSGTAASVEGLYFLLPYRGFGLDADPYRWICAGLLALNAVLTWLLARAWTGSAAGAAFGTLLVCYHPGLLSKYTRVGSGPEWIGFAAFHAALLLYARERSRSRMPRGGSLIALLALAVVAANAARPAMLLPASLIAFELLLYGASNYRSPVRWLAKHAWPILLVGAAVLAAGGVPEAAGRDPVGAYGTGLVGVRWAGFLLVAAAFAIAWGTASRVAWWASTHLVLVILLAPDPVYWGAPAWAVLVAGMGSRFEKRIPRREWVAVLLAAVLLVAAARWMQRTALPAVTRPQQRIAEVARRFEMFAPTLPRGSTVLVVNDPFPESWDLYFVAKLHYRDPELLVGLQSGLGGESRGDAADLWVTRLFLDAGGMRAYRLAPGDEE